jgi:hypothetical protein
VFEVEGTERGLNIECAYERRRNEGQMDKTREKLVGDAMGGSEHGAYEAGAERELE